MRFQSLLFWMIGSGDIGDILNDLQHWFQSLLFWMIGSGLAGGSMGLRHWNGFNPCCFG